jgi:uncharacterized protein YdcH (DUF465 family)
MSSTREARAQLAQSDPEYRKLFQEHQARERRLEELRQKGWLTGEEEQEIKRLKKEKLRFKDQMESYERTHTQ